MPCFRISIFLCGKLLVCKAFFAYVNGLLCVFLFYSKLFILWSWEDLNLQRVLCAISGFQGYVRTLCLPPDLVYSVGEPNLYTAITDAPYSFQPHDLFIIYAHYCVIMPHVISNEINSIIML